MAESSNCLRDPHPYGALLVALVLIAGCGPSEKSEAEYDKWLEHEGFAYDAEGISSELPPIRQASELAQTVVTPHPESDLTPGKNCLYCASAKLLWDLRDPTAAVETPLGQALSRVPFSERDLDPNSYLVMRGTRQAITERMRERFPGASLDLPDTGDGQLTEGFAYLQKSLPFREKFDRLEEPIAFEGPAGPIEVNAFGIEEFEESGVRDTVHKTQVRIIDYRDRDDFVVELRTLGRRDRIILAKTDPGETLQHVIMATQSRIDSAYPRGTERSEIQEGETLRVPVVSLGVMERYPELGEMLQAVRLRLDESGAKLKSYGMYECLGEDGGPREFVFDRPFLLYLIERESRNPYLAMWVANSEVLEEFAAEAAPVP